MQQLKKGKYARERCARELQSQRAVEQDLKTMKAPNQEIGSVAGDARVNRKLKL